MEKLKNIIIAELENFEFDLHEAPTEDSIYALKNEALSHINGAKKSNLFSEDEAAEWQNRIEITVQFSIGKLEYKKGIKHEKL